MIKSNCTHFQLDKPCIFHKKDAVKCGSCGKYAPAFTKNKKGTNILIIKLDAMGDVLRSTFILPGLKEKYKKSTITWITAPESVEILDNNPYLSRIWANNKEIYKKLLSEKFDIVINLDLSPASLSLMSLAAADRKIGFTVDRKRNVCFSNSYAKNWLLMSAFDDEKKKNLKTYQWHMSKILGLSKADYPISVVLKNESVRKAAAFAKKHGIKGKMVVGINPGAGKRWKLKKWTNKGYIEIIKRLIKSGYKVILFGGSQEKGLIRSYAKKTGAINAGTNNSISDFFALINLCSVLITGDTLALHAACGLNKRTVVVFGPTSANEIELYGRGIKVVSPINCTCCYITDCSKKPNCMDLIKTNDVWEAFLKIEKGS